MGRGPACPPPRPAPPAPAAPRRPPRTARSRHRPCPTAGVPDPGDWELSPEWYGTQGGGWGRGAGVVVYESASDAGNGTVRAGGGGEWRVVLRVRACTPSGFDTCALWAGFGVSKLSTSPPTTPGLRGLESPSRARLLELPPPPTPSRPPPQVTVTAHPASACTDAHAAQWRVMRFGAATRQSVSLVDVDDAGGVARARVRDGVVGWCRFGGRLRHCRCALPPLHADPDSHPRIRPLCPFSPLSAGRVGI